MFEQADVESRRLDMAWHDSIAYWARRSAPFIGLFLVFAFAIALILFVPARGAAAVLGILAGAALSYALTARSRHSVQIAVLWSAIAITADAAYARLNDLAPVTLASALTRLVDAVVKLADPLIRGLSLTPIDPRAKVAAVAPDFVWAALLALIAFMAIGYAFAERPRR
jgi:hypothetical protein